MKLLQETVPITLNINVVIPQKYEIYAYLTDLRNKQKACELKCEVFAWFAELRTL
jgi:hypothetical protein